MTNTERDRKTAIMENAFLEVRPLRNKLNGTTKKTHEGRELRRALQNEIDMLKNLAHQAFNEPGLMPCWEACQ